MSGKRGAKSEKATDVPDRFAEDFLLAMDGRVGIVRTLRQRLRELTADLGGWANLSYQERSLCKRITHLERQVEKTEAALARDRTVDENIYLSSLNTLSGLFSKIGLKRRPRPVQSLDEYVKARYSSLLLSDCVA